MAFVLMQIEIYIHLLGSIIFGSHWMNNVFSQLLAFSLCWTVSKILSYFMKLKHYTKESAWTIFIHLLHWFKKPSFKFTALTHLFIFFFNAIKLICAHFSWNNLYLLLIEKYFLGPVFFLKFNFSFHEHDKF